MSDAATDLVVVGAGPAGVAAVVMADSLGMSSVVVEPGNVGGKLHHIGALSNMPGAWQTGPDLARALATDLDRVTSHGRTQMITGRAVHVAGYDARAEVALDDGQLIAAAAVVVATGVQTLQPSDVDWLTYPERLPLPPLWRAAPDHLQNNSGVPEMVILGGDRPLGTWLRAHPQADVKVRVLYPPYDDYKVAEVVADPRVELLRADRVTVTGSGETYGITAQITEGPTRMLSTFNLLGNLGNTPAVVAGLAQGADGYCPPELQHPRILTTGDLRSARFQRIVTAQGSGAQAVLSRYYETALVTT